MMFFWGLLDVVFPNNDKLKEEQKRKENSFVVFVDKTKLLSEEMNVVWIRVWQTLP